MNTNDESLRVARARLVARGDELRDRIRRVEQDLHRTNNPLPSDAPDAAVAVENDEVLQALEETARRELNLIKGAIARIEAGTFARCEACGSDIEAARRVAVPYATRCRHCAEDG